MNYKNALYLDRLNDTKVIEVDGVDGIFIPFTPNDIIVTKGGIRLFSLQIERKPNPFRQSHFLRIDFTQRNKDKLLSMGYEEKIFGDARPIASRMTNSNYNNGNINNILPD